MPMKNLRTQEVARIAGQPARAGLYANDESKEAQAELTRRLIESNEGLRNATEENNKATSKYNGTMFDFTIILTFLAALQIVVAVLPNDMHWPWRIGIAFAPVIVIYAGLKYK
jgi:hypothetical protein